MKRMQNHGGHHMGSTSMLADSGYGPGIFFCCCLLHLCINFFYSEKSGGILKKPYIDGVSLDKEKWMDENERGLSRLDRMSASSQNQLSGMDSISEVERTLKSLNGYHEGILEALRSAANSHRGSNASSGGPPPPPNQSGNQSGAHRSSAASLTEELRKQLAAEGAYLDYSSSTGGTAGVLNDFANAIKAVSRENLNHQPTGRIGASGLDESANAAGSVPPGPIRIRNLEDLIRQLEHSSRHMSPSSGSEDLRMSTQAENEADRHFR